MIKKIAIILGVLLVLISFLAITANPLVGKYGIFYTDFAHNMIHLISGVALLYIIFQHEKILLITLRIFGFIYLALAVIGAITTDSAEQGNVLGFFVANGAGHILHLAVGLVFVVLGTKTIRMPEENIEEEYNP